MRTVSRTEFVFNLLMDTNKHLEAQVKELEKQLALANGKKRKARKVEKMGNLIMFPVRKQGGAQ